MPKEEYVTSWLGAIKHLKNDTHQFEIVTNRFKPKRKTKEKRMVCQNVQTTIHRTENLIRNEI